MYYDVTTTATFTGSVLVCFNWVEGQFHNENALRLWHMENNRFQDVVDSRRSQQACAGDREPPPRPDGAVAHRQRLGHRQVTGPFRPTVWPEQLSRRQLVDMRVAEHNCLEHAGKHTARSIGTIA